MKMMFDAIHAKKKVTRALNVLLSLPMISVLVPLMLLVIQWILQIRPEDASSLIFKRQVGVSFSR